MKKSIMMSGLLMFAAMLFAQQPVITFTQTEHDFGKINEGDGRVSTIFEFKNEGMEPLVLSNVRASCGCTTPTWTKTPVEPGQTGSITVTYNPNGRPGRFQKTITITSNATNGTERVFIKGEVIPKPAAPVQKYPVKMGDLSVSSKQIEFGTIKKGEHATKTIEYANLTDHNIKIDLQLSQVLKENFILVNPSFLELKPQESGTLNIMFDAAACKQYGPVSRAIYFVVDGKVVETEEFRVNIKADVVEDFESMTIEERQAAPIAEIASTQIDLGVVKAGSTIQKKIDLKNAGVNPLIVRAIVNNNHEKNLEVTAPKNHIKSGKFGQLGVSLRAVASDGKPLTAGTYRRQINVITNDPKNTRIPLTFVWKIE